MTFEIVRNNLVNPAVDHCEEMIKFDEMTAVFYAEYKDIGR